MKKSLILCFCVVFLFASCASEKIQGDVAVNDGAGLFEENNLSKVIDLEEDSNLRLDDDDLGKEISFTGIVSVYDGTETGEENENAAPKFVIIENDDSRSKISFVVKEEGSVAQVFALLEGAVGKSVSAKGVLLENGGPWSKVITLTELIVEE